jgi:hypothetical protein
MYITIFKIIQPYLLRYVAKYAAERLEARRQRRLEHSQNEMPSLAPEPVEVASAQNSLSARDAFWYTMSGILLGSVVGVGLAHILREED